MCERGREGGKEISSFFHFTEHLAFQIFLSPSSPLSAFPFSPTPSLTLSLSLSFLFLLLLLVLENLCLRNNFLNFESLQNLSRLSLSPFLLSVHNIFSISLPLPFLPSLSLSSLYFLYFFLPLFLFGSQFRHLSGFFHSLF